MRDLAARGMPIDEEELAEAMERAAPVPKPKECPNCEIISQPGTQVCECGYVFSADQDTTVYRQRTRQMLISGVMTVALGVGLLLWSVKLSSLWIFVLIVPGFALFFGGLKRLTRGPRCQRWRRVRTSRADGEMAKYDDH